MGSQELDVTEQLNHQRVQGEILRLERQTENQLGKPVYPHPVFREESSELCVDK